MHQWLTPDLINGLFESIGGVLLFLNVLRIVKDKRVQGLSLIPVSFWSLWGFWNLFYYPHLDQWVSFAGGLLVVGMNTIWVCLAAWYSWRQYAPMVQ